MAQVVMFFAGAVVDQVAVCCSWVVGVSWSRFGENNWELEPESSGK